MQQEVPASVFGLPVEGWGMERVLDRAFSFSNSFWIVTANPEILMEAHRNKAYAQSLLQADVRLVDGFGLWLMLRLSGKKVERVTGIELSEKLVKQATEKHLKVAFIGGYPGSAERAAEQMRQTHPTLQIMSEEGGKIDREGNTDDAGEEAKLRLTLFAPDILLVAFGHPKQERWIVKNLADFPSVKIVVGVGGTFDVWSGDLKRAPVVMCKLGLEWSWRLIQEPKRIKRIWNAVIVFPWLFLWSKATHK